MEATINVYTYRAGLLARLAHNLKFRVGEHELTVQGRRVHGYCAASSLRIDGVMTRRGLDTRALSFNDRQMITDAIRNQVLRTDKYPRIEFDGEVFGNQHGKMLVSGALLVCGQSRTVTSELTVKADHLQASFVIKPSEFGIAPFKALAGAITLRDSVRVTLDIQLGGQNPESVLGGSDAVQLTAAED